MKNKKITLITILSVSVVFICHSGDNNNISRSSQNWGRPYQTNVNGDESLPPLLPHQIELINRLYPTSFYPPFPYYQPIEIVTKYHPYERPKLKEHICEYCGKDFDQSGDLKKHILVHTNEKPFSCEICDKSFTQKGNMTRHLKIHQKEKSRKLLIDAIEKERDEVKKYSGDLQNLPMNLVYRVVGACLTYLKRTK